MAEKQSDSGLGGRMQDLFLEVVDADSTEEPAEEPAAAKGEADGGGIDWAKVAREANTMVELNKAATEAWQGRRKGVKEEDG